MLATIKALPKRVSTVALGTAGVVSSHALVVLYVVLCAAVIIPIAHVVWDYWRPTVSAYVGAPAPAASVPVRKGKM